MSLVADNARATADALVDVAGEETIMLPTLPGYMFHSVLGQGGFATVYLATQLSLNRRVALKIMNPAYAADPDLCERFVREGQDLAVLSEQVNIVTVYDVGSHGNLYFIAMQYLPGPTLKQLMQSDEPYQHPLHIITRVAEALSFAHAKGYVHRDIKPANILFNIDGEAVLSDFGIAKTENRDEQLTRMGQLVGTENYMSPEQALMFENLDGRSDLYSLGVLFFETLTRRLPYRSTKASPVLDQHVNAPVPQLPESEAQFQPLINRMMAKNREDRYASAAELLADIEQYKISEQPEETLNPAYETRWSWPLKAGAVLLILVTLALLGSFFLPGTAGRLGSPPVLSAEDQATIVDSLELAELNELLGRISSPPGSSAIDLYRLVLELDPDNAQALAGLARLQPGTGSE